MSDKVFKCPFCSEKFKTKAAVYNHLELKHESDLGDLPAAQVYFNFRNKYPLTQGNGKCVISGKPTKFNVTTERYERFYSDVERNIYRESFRDRMMQKYGLKHLLNSPEQQKKMLANRKISGKYKWSDGIHETTYTGQLELSFLKFLDLQCNWADPNDIMAPAPQQFNYIDKNGVEHFHIPDFYITSLNLIINIKSSENNHYRARDIDNELLEDKAIERDKNVKYLKIFDRKYSDFLKLINN